MRPGPSTPSTLRQAQGSGARAAGSGLGHSSPRRASTGSARRRGGGSNGLEKNRPGTSPGRLAEALVLGLAYSVRACACRTVRSTSPLLPGGDEGIRTPDPCFAKAVLSQLSYIPLPSCQLSAFSFPRKRTWLPADRSSVGLSPRLAEFQARLRSRFACLGPPIWALLASVGLSGFEPETFPLSEERSNQLS